MTTSAQRLDILHKSGKTVFSTADLAIAWGVENKNVLRVDIARAKHAGYLVAIRRGLYRIAGTDADTLELVGKLKNNSYVSFETVLAREGLIRQWYDTIFSASDRKTEIKNAYGTFAYRRLPTYILNDRRGIIHTGMYAIASKERAVCDYFYAVGYMHLDDTSTLDKKTLHEIASLYGNKRLAEDIKRLAV